MMDALYVSAIGLQAQKEHLDAVAGNFANVSTVAYKRQSIDFSAILDRAAGGPGPAATAGSEVRPSRSVRVDLAQGEIRATGRALDLAVSGPGFVEVNLADGSVGYSRAGSLRINDDGNLALDGGQSLKAEVRIPRGTSSVRIAGDGTVLGLLDGESSETLLGQIELVAFHNPESLQYRGEGIFTARDAASEPLRAKPGEAGLGRLIPGSLEGSNVRMADEMVSLLIMQRVYELNARVAQAADEMLGLTNSLRRG